MGTAPPQDDPPPDVQDAQAADAGFALGPPVASLCGFAIPSLRFSFGFKIPGLPGIAFPPAIPFPFLAIGLHCDSDNPLDVTAGVGYGGGRVSNAPPDPDSETMDEAA
jgi:hypothetical protein